MTCPQCGLAALAEIKAKLVCPACGYVQGCCDPA